jgi:hypothetical protein
MMEGGLVQLESVRTTQNEQAERASRFSGDLGLKDAFAFIGVKFGGERSSSSQAGSSQESTMEKVHTPNSLFARVRSTLYDKELVRWAEIARAEPGDFVEFSAVLQKNPLVDALEGIKAVGELALLFEEPQYQGGNRNQKRANTSNPPKQNQVAAGNSSQNVLQQMSSLLEKVRDQGGLDLIGRAEDGELQMVITLDRTFLGNSSFSELVDGEYTVLGKVTKVISGDSTESINLLRKTSLGRLQGEVIEKLTSAFGETQQQGLNLPPVVTEIRGPAMQIMPISICS